eukprot:scaffold103855_cov16-Prasinocladus_malaysianus.AAC.1
MLVVSWTAIATQSKAHRFCSEGHCFQHPTASSSAKTRIARVVTLRGMAREPIQLRMSSEPWGPYNGRATHWLNPSSQIETQMEPTAIAETH